MTRAASSIGRSVGTTLVTATDSARMTAAQVNGSSRSVKTRWPAVESAVISPKPKVRAVYSSTASCVVPSSPKLCAMLHAFDSRLRWRRPTPFGLPVVPDV